MKRRDLLILGSILILDQITKYIVFTYDSLNIKLINNFLYIGQVKNTGAAWGILSGNMFIFYIVTAIAVYFIIDIYRKSKDRSAYFNISLMLILAGALGNLIDRVFLNYVRDFIDVYIFGYDFPLFNVADSALVIGVILMIYYVIKNPHEEIL